MKRKITIIFVIGICVLLTGCKTLNTKVETYTCNKSGVDEDGNTTTNTIVVTHNNNKITKIEETDIMEVEPLVAEFVLSLGKNIAESLNTVDGINVEYSQISENQIKSVYIADYTKLKSESIKEALGDLYDEDNSIYGNLNISADEFKKSNISDGYTCS